MVYSSVLGVLLILKCPLEQPTVIELQLVCVEGPERKNLILIILIQHINLYENQS